MLKIEMNGDILRSNFQRDGFVLLRNVLSSQALSMFNYDIRMLAHEFFGCSAESFDLQTFQPKCSKDRGQFYDLLRYTPGLNALSSYPALINLSRMIGLKMPIIMKTNNIRMDLPNEDEFLFHWHQDVTYLLGSLNAITYWIPLTPVNKLNGTIEVLPGTHQFGIMPFVYTGSQSPQKDKVMGPKDISLLDVPRESGVCIEAEPGDMVVFSQMLLHRSAPNRSNLARWSVQIRHTDVDSQYIAAGCPLGDRANIYSFPTYYNVSTS